MKLISRPGTLLRLCAALLLATAAGACASTGGGAAASDSTSGSTRTVIGADLLRPEAGRSLEDVIRQYRPQWLVRRGSSSLANDGDIVVYMDTNRMGGPEALRRITADMAESVRLLSAGEATTRFGAGHVYGAIVIESRR